MSTFFQAYASFLSILRVAFFALAVLVAIIALLDWLVRTRRISPFSSISRIMRERVDPLMAPVERRIVNAGGLPTSAPWWSLVAVVVGGILILFLFEFIGKQLLRFTFSAGAGPRGILLLLISWTFAILKIAIIVRVISSWFRVSPYSPWIRWSYALSEPILRPLRGIIPTLGMIDITPIVAYFLLVILENLLFGLL